MQKTLKSSQAHFPNMTKIVSYPMHEIASGPKNIYKNNKNQHTKKNGCICHVCLVIKEVSLYHKLKFAQQTIMVHVKLHVLSMFQRSTTTFTRNM